MHAMPGRVSLGARLFSDRRLSGDETKSCASCHDLRTNGAGSSCPDAKSHVFKTITVFNAALKSRLGWFGQDATLEDQAAGSIEGAGLLNAIPARVVERLRIDRSMAARFVAVYGHGPDWSSLLDAVATFERTLLTPASRFDLYLEGDGSALTSGELAGYRLFKSIGCVACHQGVEVGGNLFERLGVVDPNGVSERQVFLVPSLRNVATNAPYFHDGSIPTLQGAISRMASAQLGRTLTASEVASVTEFLRTLTGRNAGRPVTTPG